jgi:hypothetical protein
MVIIDPLVFEEYNLGVAELLEHLLIVVSAPELN